MAVVVFLGSTLLHEFGGHGGACLATGGRLNAIGAFYIDCTSANAWAERIVSAAGSTANLAAAGLAAIVFGFATTAIVRLFWWLAFTINVLVWSGYFLFSGLSGIGDWSDGGVLTSAPNIALWRSALAVGGALFYMAGAFISARMLSSIVGAGPDARRAARRIAWTAYFAGGIVSVLVGLLNPLGIFILLASAAASSFGGTSGLLWLTSFISRSGEARAVAIPRSWVWIAIGVLTTAAYAALLGPSITL
jgi:hypothetical protein